MTQHWYDCPNCGETGKFEELKEHPTRPMPEDLGFCPHCDAPIDELITEARVRELLIEYGDDPDKFVTSKGG